MSISVVEMRCEMLGNGGNSEELDPLISRRALNLFHQFV
jgi:hypothetical protein